MKRVSTTLALLTTVVVAVGLMTTQSTVVGKGKPSNEKPPKGDPPPVLYRIDEILSPTQPNVRVIGMNNLGMVIGRHGDFAMREVYPYVYFQSTAELYDLNVELGSQLDTLIDPQLNPGWFFESANAMNDPGDVVGRLHNLLTGDHRGFVIETFLSTDPDEWVLSLLPTQGTNDSEGYGINDFGYILMRYDDHSSGYVDRNWALYNHKTDPPTELQLNLGFNGTSARINNSAQVVVRDGPDTVVLFDPEPQPPSMTFYDVHGVYLSGFNDAGVFCGRAWMKLNGRGGNDRVLVRYSTASDTLDTIVKGNSAGGKQGINSSGDIHFQEAYEPRARLLHTGFPLDPEEVILDIDDLISPTDPLRDVWLNNETYIEGMTDRSDTVGPSGYPQLSGGIRVDGDDGGYRGVVLTPISP